MKMEKEAREQESRITDRATQKGSERTEEKHHDQGKAQLHIMSDREHRALEKF